jgi:hypothetical protein
MGDCCIRIEKLANGFTVEMKDPAICKANAKRDAMRSNVVTPWRDPWKTFVCNDEASLLKFLKANLSKAVAEGDDYECSFNTACIDED